MSVSPTPSAIRFTLSLVSVVLTNACTSLNDEILSVAERHTIMANPEGQLVSVRDHTTPLSAQESKELMTSISNELKEYVEASDGSQPVKVLFFIHGGLNQSKQSILRAGCWTHAIMTNADELPDCKKARPTGEPALDTDGYFPIFVNWRSWLASTYAEHLVATRQGERWNAALGWGTAPFVLFADLGRAITRAPLVWIQQGRSGLDTYRGTPPFDDKDVVFKHYERLKEHMDDPGEQIHISIGEDEGPPGILGDLANDNNLDRYYNRQKPDGSWVEGATGFATTVITLPTKLVASPLIDGTGKPAWDMMNRRTELLRRQPQEYDDLVNGEVYPPRTGALAQFLDFFIKEFPHSEAGESPVEVTIIGHSMGTIVANWMVADYGEKLNLKNIVYMAAAAKMSDFERAVIPYLASPAGQDTEFYNMTLHPRAEVRERNVGLGTRQLDLAPRGSLLVWIDNYLSNPESFLDRTLGRWDNIVVAPHIFPEDIRCRVHIKAFGVLGWHHQADPSNPQKHGEFTDGAFWRNAYWDPVGSAEAESCQPQRSSLEADDRATP